MEIEDYLNEELQKLQKPDTLIVDNSAMSNFRLCRRKFLYRNALSLAPKKEKEALTFGSAFHKALHLYYSNHSVEDCLKALIEESTKETSSLAVFKDEKENGKNEYTVEFATELFLNYTKLYPQTEESFSFVLNNENKPYLEVGFSLALDNGIVCGRIDGIISTPFGLGIIEHKTTTKPLNSSYFTQFNPNTQITLYLAVIRELIAPKDQPKIAIINAIRLKDYKSPKYKSEEDQRKFSRFTTFRDPSQLDRVLRQLDMELFLLKNAYEIGADAFYQNAPQGCFYRQPCEYLPLCLVRDVSTFKAVVEGEYRVEPWHPYEDNKEKE